MSVLTYSAPSGPRVTLVGTASDWAKGGLNGPAGTAIDGKTATSETSPFGVTRSRELPPASVTSVAPASASTPNGLESTGPPAGFSAPSNALTSATTFHWPLGATWSSEPNPSQRPETGARRRRSAEADRDREVAAAMKGQVLRAADVGESGVEERGKSGRDPLLLPSPET